MKVTYQRSLLWFLVPILMIPLAYGQNETILVATFMNGNNAVLNSRIYLFNSSDTAGDITVRVFRLPLLSGVPQELTGTPLPLGSLGAKSALNIKLAEDILVPLGIALPYTNDGGNLTVEFTVGAEKVRGVAQVFTSDFAFGTYPLQGPESTGGTSSEIPDGSVGSAQLAEQVDFGAFGSRGLVRMLNSTGAVVTELGATSTDDGFLTLRDSTGDIGVGLGAGADGSGGFLFLLDTDFNPTAFLGNTGLGGFLVLYSATGNAVVALGVDDDGTGGLSLLDSGDNLLARMGRNVAGHGFIETKNAIGNAIVRITSSDAGGFISVRNSSGTQTAGIQGSTGLVFGNIKSFIVPDPSDSNRMIKYTSVEGPEAAIYVRGTANLVSGQGHIDFPDHFAVMAAPSSITVSLTPRSASSMGLAAVSVSSQGIDVAELGGGTNSYSFDYVAYAVRKGFEDYEVYLTQEQVRRLTGQAQTLESRPQSLSTIRSRLKTIQQQE